MLAKLTPDNWIAIFVPLVAAIVGAIAGRLSQKLPISKHPAKKIIGYERGRSEVIRHNVKLAVSSIIFNVKLAVSSIIFIVFLYPLIWGFQVANRNILYSINLFSVQQSLITINTAIYLLLLAITGIAFILTAITKKNRFPLLVCYGCILLLASTGSLIYRFMANPIESKPGYILNPSPSETRQWQSAMKKAEEEILEQNNNIGIVALRVFIEHEELENNIQVDGYGISIPEYSNHGLHTVSSGEIFLATVHYKDEEIGNKSASINIGSIYHCSPKIDLIAQKGKAIIFGDILVQSLPIEQTGRLTIKIKHGEKGLQLKNGKIIFGRYELCCGTKKMTVDKDGHCFVGLIAPGTYEFQFKSPKNITSLPHKVTVTSGEIIETEASVFKRRLVEIDWRFRRSQKSPVWLHGSNKLKTGESWHFCVKSENFHHDVFKITDWNGQNCYIQQKYGYLALLETQVPFEELSFPTTKCVSYRKYAIKEGATFSWWGEDSSGPLEALIRIKKITPVGLLTKRKSASSSSP
ncbi:MAG: hypothetical protein ACYSSI_12515 [Planctomycetota bacterium]|jgi:hypothetical protein